MSAATLALVAALLAVPFEDAGHRFALDLPDGWEFAAKPGDTGGAVFRRVGDGLLINAAVRLMPLGAPVTLATFVGRIGAAADQEPGFRLLEHGTTPLAGTTAARRRYVVFVNGDRKLSKIVEQRIMVVAHTGIVLHAETLAEAYPGCADSFAHFFNSFRLGGGTPPPPALAAPRGGGAQALVGTWQGGGHTLAVAADGSVRLDGIAGTYQVDHGVLILSLISDQRIFRYSLAHDALRLTGSTFGDGQVLRRSR